MPATEQDDDGLVHAHVLDGRGGAELLDWNGVERWQPDHGVLWVHLDYTSATTQSWLAMRSGIDPVIREALLDADPRPRVLQIGDALLMIVRAINLNAGAQPEDMVSLRCWVEPTRIITLRHRLVRVVRTLGAELAKGKGPKNPGDFVADAAIRSVEPVIACVDGIDDEVAHLEVEVLGEHRNDLRSRLADLRRRAIALRRFIAPQRDAFTRLAQTTLPWMDDHDRARLREAADRQTRTVEELDAARDRAAVTHEEMSSRLGELTNTRLYVLSIMTAIFLPLGFITSLLGVNVGGIPGRDVEWGFWLLCTLFGVGIFVQIWLFRRWKWLGRRP